MWTALRGLGALVLTSLLLTATASAGDALTALEPVYDITHFDVIPFTSPVDSEQIAYAALFAYRDASRSDPGLESFRIINWLAAPNHSFIVDVYNNRDAFEQHLAQRHSVKFRFSVQDLPAADGGCCIGSPIDDRQYSLVESIGTPWISTKLPKAVGPTASAAFVLIYIDFLQEVLEDFGAGVGQHQLVQYGATTSNMNGKHLLDYTVLRQLDRPNRYVVLEVWDTAANYNAWQSSSVTASFVAQIKPLLGSPPDYRVNSLCGKTYVDGTGCTPP